MSHDHGDEDCKTRMMQVLLDCEYIYFHTTSHFNMASSYITSISLRTCKIDRTLDF